jgi:hypothetical protein
LLGPSIPSLFPHHRNSNHRKEAQPCSLKRFAFISLTPVRRWTDRSHSSVLSAAQKVIRGRNLLSSPLNVAKQRADFIRSIPGFGSSEQQEKIKLALLRMAERRGNVREATGEEGETNTTESVIFKALYDGRLIEQLAGRVFAVYDDSSVDTASKVECDGITYLPISGDPCIEDNDLHLPKHLIEYGEERLLDEEIEDYLSKFCSAQACLRRRNGKTR